MESPKSRCPGCSAMLAGGALPYRGYYNASAECWAEYTQVLAVEYQNAVLFGQVHQLTVDAYAVQHAGGPHPDKSVCLHLVGLHLVLERDFKPFDVPARMQQVAATHPAWPHFEPPTLRSAVTAHVVAKAKSTIEHAELVRRWAEETWSAWGAHHAAVAGLVNLSFATSERGRSK
ncbi:MAG TPA: DUF5946 family protein [Planctomycetota bacterium]|nr:DUF5946 family protein [Planctomycetota bacterium]